MRSHFAPVHRARQVIAGLADCLTWALSLPG